MPLSQVLTVYFLMHQWLQWQCFFKLLLASRCQSKFSVTVWRYLMYKLYSSTWAEGCVINSTVLKWNRSYQNSTQIFDRDIYESAQITILSFWYGVIWNHVSNRHIVPYLNLTYIDSLECLRNLLASGYWQFWSVNFGVMLGIGVKHAGRISVC